MPSHLVIGGISSGKSLFAELLAENIFNVTPNLTLHYLATAPMIDDEMIKKISIHKERRSKHWNTIEEELDIYEKISNLPKNNQIILIECITTWLSNMTFNQIDITENVELLVEYIRICKENHIIIVSNDLGESVISENKETRFFQQLNGNINQQIAQITDNVHKVIAGINLKIK